MTTRRVPKARRRLEAEHPREGKDSPKTKPPLNGTECSPQTTSPPKRIERTKMQLKLKEKNRTTTLARQKTPPMPAAAVGLPEGAVWRGWCVCMITASTATRLPTGAARGRS
jgi:hypothetical protein